MPIIYTYPTVTPASDDLLLLSDVSDSRKITKSATISSVLGLGIDTKRVVVSSAEILALHTTPIELIPAPGANKVIQLLYPPVAYIDFNSINYIKGPLLLVMFAGASGYIYNWTQDVLSAGADEAEYASLPRTGALTAYVNTAINLSISVAASTGDSPITFYLTYKTLDI